jgi:hypothetical protein
MVITPAYEGRMSKFDAAKLIGRKARSQEGVAYEAPPPDLHPHLIVTFLVEEPPRLDVTLTDSGAGETVFWNEYVFVFVL